MAVNSNPTIDIPVVTSKWEIDPALAIEYYSEYVSDLQKVDKGVPFSELEYSKKREESRPRVYDLDQNSFVQAGISDFDRTPPNSIAVIRIKGAMRLEDGFSSQGIRSTAQSMQKIDQNPRIQGLILEINSGGGEALAGTMLQNAVAEFQKPVVALVHIAASAAYKGILPADQIIASAQESQVGSIGTMTTFNKRLLQYMKDNFIDLYAPGSEQKNLEFRELQKGNQGPIIQKLEEVNTFFIQQVKDFRDISGTEQMVAEVFQGKLMNAEQGYNVGLVDGIGTMTKAIALIAQINEGIIPKQNAPVKSGIDNQNLLQMNFKQFISRLIPSLNSKLGIELEQTSSAQEVIQAVEDAPDVVGLQNELKDIKDQLTSHAQQLKQTTEAKDADQTKDKGDNVKEKKEEVEDPMQAILEQLKEMQQSIATLKGENDTLTQELIDAKGAKSDQNGDNVNGKVNSRTTDMKTIQHYNGQFELEGKSQF